MIDPLSWSLGLGRWAGTRVRIHAFFLAFVALVLLAAWLGGGSTIATMAWLVMLVVALALHELGHAAMASHLGAEIEDVQFWPLGNFAPPSPHAPARPTETILIALAGPILSFVLALVSAVGLSLSHARLQFNPFAPDGTPMLASGEHALPLSGVWYIGWFGYLNWMICLLNLIPAPPLDNGRVFRAAWASTSRDAMVPTWTARACAAILFAVGILRLFNHHTEQGTALMSLAMLVEWMVRTEVRMIEDGGFFDDGIFGYDFSQGYTSLEAGAPTVRPYRESALRRWRRRRSDLRLQRRLEQEAAEERRMDEILEKLHREGKPGLTDAEYRFLVRVSHKYRNRVKARG